MPNRELLSRDGAIAVCAADEGLREQIESTLTRAGHEVLSCQATLGEAVAAAEHHGALALVLACSQATFARAIRVRSLQARWLSFPLVVVATGSWDTSAWRILRLGAEALVRESELEQTLVTSVEAVLANQLCLPGEMRDAIARPALSHREKQVLELALSGLTNGEIGRRLFLSESTVKSHLSSSFRKLHVSSRAEAARRVHRRPLSEPAVQRA